MKMKRTLKAMAAAAALIPMICIPAGDTARVCAAESGISAEAETGLVTKDGKIYFIGSDGNYITGWKTIGKNKYWFTADGSAAVKPTVIDGIKYRFSSKGVCKGKYTGFSRTKTKTFYYRDGRRLKGKWQTIDGKSYYFLYGSGEMAKDTNLVVGGYVYPIDEKGVWDGTKTAYRDYMLSLRVSTAGELFGKYNSDEYDMYFSVNYVKRPADKDVRDTLFEMLSGYSDRKVIYTEHHSGDEIDEPAEDINSTTDDIVICFKKKGEKSGYTFMYVTRRAVFYNGDAINSWAVYLDDTEIYDYLYPYTK